MKTRDARKLIGAYVAWDDILDKNRGTHKTRGGKLDDVFGRNVVVDGQYHWLPRLDGFRQATAEDIALIRR